ncbi:MAG: hypothetical protein PUB18_03575 [bacterium]|nr:hypothetical protein [bacterium]
MATIIQEKKERYADLKNLAYSFYHQHYRFWSEEGRQLLQKHLENLGTDEERKIFLNTLQCPFDIELFNQTMTDLVYTSETIHDLVAIFDINPKVFKEKMNEYRNYYFINCVGEKLIDYKLTFELSKLFAQRQSENGKEREKAIK